MKIIWLVFFFHVNFEQLKSKKILHYENFKRYVTINPLFNESFQNLVVRYPAKGGTEDKLKHNNNPFSKMEKVETFLKNQTENNPKQNLIDYSFDVKNEPKTEDGESELFRKFLEEDNDLYEDFAITPLWPQSDSEEFDGELEYVELTSDLVNDEDHTRLVEYYEDLEEKRDQKERHKQKLRRKRSLYNLPDRSHLLSRFKNSKKSKWRNFDDFWDHYKILKSEIEESPNGVTIKKILEMDKKQNTVKEKKEKEKENHKRDKRGKLPITLQDLNEINQFMLTILETVRSWLVYEENGRVPRPKMELETLLKAFSLYYECMEERFKHYEKMLGQPMTDVLAFNTLSSEKVTLECRTCLPPFTNPLEYGIVWYRRLLHEGGAYKALPNNENKFSITLDGDLTMHQLTPEDGGMYTCFNNGAHGVTYLLGIDDVESRVRVYEHANDIAMATKPEILAEYNLYVFYQWSTWSACNRCNGAGSRKRVGTCMVKKFDRNVPTQPVESSALKKYKEGLPCISPLIPHPLYEAANLMERKTELMISLCYNSCVTQPPVRVVTDENGKQLDVVASFKGRSSYYEGVPKLGVPIERLTQFAIMNRKFVLKCPHKNASKLPVRWQNGTVMLEESRLGYLTKFRVKINQRNELVINRVLKSDEAFFSCWNNLQHFGTIRLYVREPMTFRIVILDAIRQCGFVICTGTLIYIVFKLYFMGSRAPKQYK